MYCLVSCRMTQNGIILHATASPDLQDEADEEPEASDGEAEQDAMDDEPASEGRDEL